MCKILLKNYQLFQLYIQEILIKLANSKISNLFVYAIGFQSGQYQSQGVHWNI